jgi:serine/threonine-protein kinase
VDPWPRLATLDGEATRALAPFAITPARAPRQLLGGRYRLDALLGEGGMGQVYRAHDVVLERTVAVKLLAGLETSEARARFLREARDAAALNHPHIVAVHDLGEEAGTLFLVMELVSGGSLREATAMSPSTVVEVAHQLALALAHAHGHGLVHRDVKPANVLLVGGDRAAVKLADLGLAMSLGRSRLTLDGAIVGTVAYLAPEQAVGGAVDGRADLYSLGVVLYELVTGRLPFQGSHIELISQHLHAAVVPPRRLRPDLDPALERIILRLLAKDPTERFASAVGLAQALSVASTARPLGKWLPGWNR